MHKESTQNKVFALTHHFTVEDEFEISVQHQILEPILDKDSFTVLNFNGAEDNKTAEKYFRAINSVAFRLLQAYKHYKNYSIIENARTEELLKEINKSQRFIDERWRPLELNCELDAFLTKWKSTLDALVKSLIPLFGTSTLLFSKDKKYHFKIIKEIKTRMPREVSSKLEKLCTLITESAEDIHKIVKLRDDVVHYDKECLTPYHYHLPKKELFPPNLEWNNILYKPQDFMVQATELLRDFARDFMVCSLNSYVTGMYLVVSDDGHQWCMLQK